MQISSIILLLANSLHLTHAGQNIPSQTFSKEHGITNLSCGPSWHGWPHYSWQELVQKCKESCYYVPKSSSRWSDGYFLEIDPPWTARYRYYVKFDGVITKNGVEMWFAYANFRDWTDNDEEARFVRTGNRLLLMLISDRLVLGTPARIVLVSSRGRSPPAEISCLRSAGHLVVDPSVPGLENCSTTLLSRATIVMMLKHDQWPYCSYNYLQIHTIALLYIISKYVVDKGRPRCALVTRNTLHRLGRALLFQSIPGLILSVQQQPKFEVGLNKDIHQKSSTDQGKED